VKDYTLVVGVDAKHLEQLRYTWPTWKRHKPSLLKVPMIVFCDPLQVTKADVWKVVDHPRLTVVDWQIPAEHYRCSGEQTKWTKPQRSKMLAGFVCVPPQVVMTRYWLKIDTDTVATGDDDWIDPDWFEDCPAIVSAPWGYTKPADQMMKLDEWVERNRERLPLLSKEEPLKLRPKEGWSRVKHRRIISWCAFFHTRFTAQASRWAAITCGAGKLPVDSQDGFLWYCATRLGFGVVRAGMKNRGWQHWSTMGNIRKHSREAMEKT